MKLLVNFGNCLSRQFLQGMPTTCDFTQCGILTSVDSDEPM